RSVRHLNDLLFLHDPKKRARTGEFKFYLGTYPWGDHVGGGPWGYHHDQIENRMTRDLYGCRGNIWYEPGDTYPIEREWNKTIAVYNSVKAYGYRPLTSGGLPEVTLLVRRDGAIRAMRYNGQHRLSVLSHIGYGTISTLIPSARSITESLATWPSV